jgi:DNA polymerase I-like protein with 3'-5' exonuclease and polymerase domains
MVAAPEGYTFIGGDYSGIEWAIAMWYCAKEYNDGYHIDMLDRFYRGEFDPHNFLAEIAGCERQVAKVFTHGYNYDGSPRTLARNAGLSDSIGITVCTAHDKAFRTRSWKDALVSRAKKEHKIQTPLGWRCYNWAWQPKPSEVLAWLVQGTAADLCKWVMKSIFEGMPPDCRLVTSTHDSFLLQVPISGAQRQKEWLAEQMQQPIPWLGNRQWRADVRQGRTWKDVS